MIEISTLDDKEIKVKVKNINTAIKHLLKDGNTLSHLKIYTDQEIKLTDLKINQVIFYSPRIEFINCKIGQIIFGEKINTERQTNIYLHKCSTLLESSYIAIQNINYTPTLNITDSYFVDSFAIIISNWDTRSNRNGYININNSILTNLCYQKNVITHLNINNSSIKEVAEYDSINIDPRLIDDTTEPTFKAIASYINNDIPSSFRCDYDIRYSNFYKFKLICGENHINMFLGNRINGDLVLFAFCYISLLDNFNFNIIQISNFHDITKTNIITKKLFKNNIIKFDSIQIIIKDLFNSNTDRIGYKIIKNPKNSDAPCMCKLLIPKEALSLEFPGDDSYKKRCSYAKVLNIYELNDINKTSIHTPCKPRYHSSNTTTYQIDRYTRADCFDLDETKQCSGGIHFFDTEEEALDYSRIFH